MRRIIVSGNRVLLVTGRISFINIDGRCYLQTWDQILHNYTIIYDINTTAEVRETK